MVLIPAGVIPLRDSGFSTRDPRPWIELGATYSLPLPLGAGAEVDRRPGAPIDLYRALLCRHRCQSSINTVTRRPAQSSIAGHSTSGRVVRRIPCNHTPRPSNLPSNRRESDRRDKTRNTLLVDPPKATKGRRMSKKTRKKSSKDASARRTANRPRRARPNSVGQGAGGKSPQGAGEEDQQRPRRSSEASSRKRLPKCCQERSAESSP